MLKLRRLWSVGDEDDAGLCSKNIEWRLDAFRGVGWTINSTMNGRSNAEQHHSFPLFFSGGVKFPFSARGAAGIRKLGAAGC